MPRGIVVLILIVVVISGLLWFLSSRAGEVPTRTIEVEVNTPANAR
jgi:hypothetical protein